jgi:hypothetical protein
MIAEWTMGTYPLKATWGHETADHLPLEAPSALRSLLERAMSPELAARSPLPAFIAELEQVAR